MLDVRMQKHFNRHYMESEKFPTAKFEGKIDNLGEIKNTAAPNKAKR